MRYTLHILNVIARHIIILSGLGFLAFSPPPANSLPKATTTSARHYKPRKMQTFDGEIVAVAWSPSNKETKLALAIKDHGITLLLLDSKQGAAITELSANKEYSDICALDWLPEEGIIASYYSGAIAVFLSPSSQQMIIKEASQYPDRKYMCQFVIAPSGASAAIRYQSGDIFRINWPVFFQSLKALKPEKTRSTKTLLSQHERLVSSAPFNKSTSTYNENFYGTDIGYTSNSSFLYVIYKNNTVKAWRNIWLDFKNDDKTPDIQQDIKVTCPISTKKSKIAISSGNNAIHVYSINNPRRPPDEYLFKSPESSERTATNADPLPSITALCWNKKRKLVAIGTSTGIKIWPYKKNDTIIELKPIIPVEKIAPDLISWNQDGSHLAATFKNMLYIWHYR